MLYLVSSFQFSSIIELYSELSPSSNIFLMPCSKCQLSVISFAGHSFLFFQQIISSLWAQKPCFGSSRIRVQHWNLFHSNQPWQAAHPAQSNSFSFSGYTPGRSRRQQQWLIVMIKQLTTAGTRGSDQSALEVFY